MSLRPVRQFSRIRKNRKTFYFCTVIVLLIILYKTTGPTKIEEKDQWNPKLIRGLTDNIHKDCSIIPASFCQYMTILLVLVHSSPSNFKNRHVIRATWKNDISNLFFVLGNTTDETLQEQISRESQRHGDIIQINFVDSPANKAVKSIVSLKFAILCTLQSTYLLKTDDDTLVNINRIEEMLFGRRFPEDLLTGDVRCTADPTYSGHLFGGAYLMSMSVAHKLYQEALKTPLLHLGDVFLTGICAQKAGIKLEHSDFFAMRSILQKPCRVRQVYTVSRVTPEEMLFLSGELRTEYNMADDCREDFSVVELFFDVAFPFKKTPFSYTKTCH